MKWATIWPLRWLCARAVQPIRKHTSFRLSLEQLEDRLNPSTLSLSASFAADTAGQAYSATFHATGGDGNYHFALASGALPKGLALSSSAGVLSGDTTVAGSFAFSVVVTDPTENIASATKAVTLVVNPAAAATFAVGEPTFTTVGGNFVVTVNAHDAFGNTATGFVGSLVFTSSDGQIVNVATSAFHNGVGTATVSLGKPDTLTLSAVSGTIKGTGGSITVVPNDWFSANMSDPGLQILARADYARDGAITYSDILGLFAKAQSAGALTAAELQSLKALASTSGAAAVHMASSVQNLTYKVVDGDPANASYQGKPLGNLGVGSTATHLQELVAKWFLGENLPAIDTEYTQGWGTVTYGLASGTLFSSNGPSYKDVDQGEEGDCWLLSSFGVTAAHDPSLIRSMFTDDGTTTENGVLVHVWTVRFYNNGVPSYLTVNNYFPEAYGMFAYANLGQLLTSSSNVLWVPLLEKAYAELCPSGWNQRPASNAYASLNAGTSTTALPIITGGTEIWSTFSQSTFIAAIAAGDLLTFASSSLGNSKLGIVQDHDYGVLGYNAATQTFTLLNPWGWNNTSGSPGILNLTWAQISANFTLDGDCSP